MLLLLYLSSVLACFEVSELSSEFQILNWSEWNFTDVLTGLTIPHQKTFFFSENSVHTFHFYQTSFQQRNCPFEDWPW